MSSTSNDVAAYWSRAEKDNFPIEWNPMINAFYKAGINEIKNNFNQPEKLLSERFNHITGFQIQKWLNDKKVAIDFIKENNYWNEYQDGKVLYTYEEIERTSNTIILHDLNRLNVYLKIFIASNLKDAILFFPRGEYKKGTNDWNLLFGSYEVYTPSKKYTKFSCIEKTGCDLNSGFELVDQYNWIENKKEGYFASFKEYRVEERTLLLFDESRKIFVKLSPNKELTEAYAFWQWGSINEVPGTWNVIPGKFKPLF
jgi:hypothetical protein